MLPLYRWKRRPATDIMSDSKGRCGVESVTGGVKGSPQARTGKVLAIKRALQLRYQFEFGRADLLNTAKRGLAQGP